MTPLSPTSINLASDPFRRERARNAVLAATAAALLCTLLILTVLILHSRAKAADLRRQIAAERAQLQSLQARQSGYSAVLAKPGNADVFARNVFLNELIARRAVSWTLVFRDLEKTLPANMRLIGIRLPQVAGEDVNGTNRVQLDMIVGTDRPDSVIDLLKRLESSDLFGAAQVINQQPPTQTNHSIDSASQLPMPRNFSFLPASGAMEQPRFWLQAGVALLAILNLIALFLYLDPPGGSRAELSREGENVRSQINTSGKQAARLQSVSAKVQLGSRESDEFLARFILPKRVAFSNVIGEIQRIAKVSGIQEKDASYSTEPIEGTSDLTLLNSSANYEGSYDSLRKFLYEVDRSPYLIMLESLTANPQQHGSQINTSIKFQAVIKEDGATGPLRGQP